VSYPNLGGGCAKVELRGGSLFWGYGTKGDWRRGGEGGNEGYIATSRFPCRQQEVEE
jgi:hypothetical protein